MKKVAGRVVAAIAIAGLTACGSGAARSGAKPATSTTSVLQPGSSVPSGSVPSTSAPSSPSSAGPDWLGYQATLGRTGAVPATGSPGPVRAAWTAHLGAAVYGEALVADGLVYAATEDDEVFALDARTGAKVWTASLGPPLRHVDEVAGCGDIDPLGITSTPVADPATGTIYVVGEVSDGGGVVHHQLKGLSMATGAVRMSVDVDPPLPAGEQAVNLLQRASLAIANGRVYVSYGGNDGDCGHYHGWVVGVDLAGPPDQVSFEVASDGEGGAIWEGGGGPAVDPDGDLFVSTGNANPDPPLGGPDPKKYTESVVKLTPDLVPLASFKDEVAGGDEDLATGNPVLLPDGDVFAVGKTDIGYVLTQANLSEVAAIRGVCRSDPDGGPAFDAASDSIFVPCRGGGIQEIDLANRRLEAVWPGANSTPIVVGGDVWAAQYPDGTLTEFAATTGAVLQTFHVGPVPNFVSPSAGAGLLLVPTMTGVTALTGA